MQYVVAFLLGIGFGLLLNTCAEAHDPTGYWAREAAEGRAPDATWWKGLHSSGGLLGGIPCCDVTDGEKVIDVDWDTWRAEKGDVHYRVKLLGKWQVVPDSAVVPEPNRYGPAVVWPVYGWDGDTKVVSYIRCFLPGSGS
jgi:hypothetical protein